MSKNILKSFLFSAVIIALFSFDLPAGWFKAGSKPKSYEMGIDKGKGPDGKNAATIKSIDKKIMGFGTLMQSCKADKYLGKRIRMSGFLKSENVKEWAGLWLRVDKGKKTISFDNMYKRPVKETTDWKKYEIVLDVPDSSSALAFGALLSGTGQIWFDNITFEVVSDSVKVTGYLNGGKSSMAEEPSNLDFEK